MRTGFAGFQLPASKGGGECWLRVEMMDENHNGYLDEVEAIDWACNDAGNPINGGGGRRGESDPIAPAFGRFPLHRAGTDGNVPSRC